VVAYDARYARGRRDTARARTSTRDAPPARGSKEKPRAVPTLNGGTRLDLRRATRDDGVRSRRRRRRRAALDGGGTHMGAAFSLAKKDMMSGCDVTLARTL
jgi:hypothetical protein